MQENLEMVVKSGKHQLVGFVDLGKGHDIMSHLSGKGDPELASQVLQFVFLSDCGFRCPIAQFPSGSCTPSDLYFLFWEGVLKMLEEGFTIYWCILDGADVNRQFIKIHFKDTDPAERNFMTHNIYTYNPMVFIMDPKHNIKKIRNNISKSNVNVRPRCLQVNGNTIIWKQFKEAYNWHQANFSLPVHERLSELHFELDSAGKMRNHLAENVLDRKMLFLMQKYQEHLSSVTQDNGQRLDATIELLGHTSRIVQLFNDKHSITSLTDPRLTELSKKPPIVASISFRQSFGLTYNQCVLDTCQ
ncbi:uncharacterized protein [Montipora foliosa]|uniref:uncharacterized protein n=1 Tax=Montipora foliosa TaxID=591990 RepID=UPI0035F19ED3